MKVFTISSGSVSDGARVEKFSLTGGTEILAVLVGENGRGSKLGVLPVDPSAIQFVEGCEILSVADVGETKSGQPKLVQQKQESDFCLCVFRTKIGFRGGNSHTGDRDGVDEQGHLKFLPFPGTILCQGIISQGAAGRMGSGDQIVAVVPKGAIFRTGYSGRLYGAPAAHYYRFDGVRIVSATWEERQVADLF